MYCDMHIHSVYSDGTDSVGEIIHKAIGLNLDQISITDHDSVGGVQKAIDYAGERLKVISGMEFDSDYVTDNGVPMNSIHILGHGIDIHHKALKEYIAEQIDSRNKRNDELIKLLNKAGVPVTKESACPFSRGGVIGKPHIARAIVSLGAADSVNQAFKQYLNEGMPAYVRRKQWSSVDVISLIHDIGGEATLAHPYAVKFDREQDKSIENKMLLVKELVNKGIDIVEVYHPQNKPEFRELMLEFCKSQNIRVSCGSDYHGKTKPNAIGCFDYIKG